MPSTFEKVAKIIADTSEIDIDTITPDSHTIDDLGIDSLDFLDIVFAIDKEFGIKVPLEKWTQKVNDGKVSTEEYFVMRRTSAPRSTSWSPPRRRRDTRQARRRTPEAQDRP